MNVNNKNTHINTIQIKENKQLNIQQKQNYPGLVASYDTQPGNEMGLFYNGPEHHTDPSGSMCFHNGTLHSYWPGLWSVTNCSALPTDNADQYAT